MDSGVLLATTLTNASDVASYQVATLHDVSHSITAFATDGVTTNVLTLLASPNPTILTTTPAAPIAGQTLNLSATVTSQSTTTIPTGSVTFTDSGANLRSTTLNATGNGAFTTTAIVFAATYVGTSDFSGSSASRAITLVRPDYVLSANPSSLTIVAAQSGSTTLPLTPQNGFVDTVQLFRDSLPQNLSCSFSNITPSLSGTAPQTVQLTTLHPFGIGSGPETAYSSSPSVWLAFLIAPFLFGMRRTKKNLKNLSIVVSILTLTAITVLSGCSGGGKGAPSGTGNALPGTLHCRRQRTLAAHRYVAYRQYYFDGSVKWPGRVTQI